MSATSSLLDQLYEAPVVQRLREQSFNRAIAHIDHQTSVSDHHVVREQLVNELIEELHGASAADLLAELRELGLLWSVVAQIVGVTDAAIRKWRRGDSIESTHYRRLARLVALARLYGTYTMPESPTAFGEWLERRVVPRFSATPSQLFALSRDSNTRELQPLLDWMLGHSDGEQAEGLLDRYLGPRWRDEAEQEQRFRIVTTAGGDRLLLLDE